MDPATMTCADLMAMDEAGQMEAMSQREMAAAETEGKEMTSDEAMTSGEQMMPGTMTACEGNPDMMAMDACTRACNRDGPEAGAFAVSRLRHTPSLRPGRQGTIP